MSDRICIHVGYHKAASTFLQKVVFPAMPGEMSMVFGPELKLLHAGSETNRDEVLEIVRSRVTPSPDRLTVLTNEFLTGATQGQSFSDPFAIATGLQAVFPESKILIVTRNQFDYLLSLYAFRVCVRGYEFLSLPQWLQRAVDLGILAKLAYDRLVRHYVDLFGRNAVMVIPMEELGRDGSSFIRRICEFFGCPPVDLPSRERVNPSLRSTGVLEASRVLNLPVAGIRSLLEQMVSEEAAKHFKWWWFKIKRFKVNPALDRFLGSSPDLDLPRDWKRRLGPGFADSNHRLAEFVKDDLEDLGYPF